MQETACFFAISRLLEAQTQQFPKDKMSMRSLRASAISPRAQTQIRIWDRHDHYQNRQTGRSRGEVRDGWGRVGSLSPQQFGILWHSLTDCCQHTECSLPTASKAFLLAPHLAKQLRH